MGAVLEREWLDLCIFSVHDQLLFIFHILVKLTNVSEVQKKK